MIAGLSYGCHTGSLAYPLRRWRPPAYDHELIALVLEAVHPGNLGPLPPSPSWLASKGVQIGLGTFEDFFR